MARAGSRKVIVLIVSGAVLAGAFPSFANPINLLPNTTNFFRDTRSLNDVGVGNGDFFQYGADIQGGSNGTTLSATYPPTGFTDPATPCVPLAVNGNFCANITAFSSARIASPWTLQFKNGADTLNVTGPSLAGTADPVPFPVSVTITGSGVNPTISWTIPGGFAPDGFQVQIFDKSITLANGQNDITHSVAINPSSTSYTIPTILSSGGRLIADGQHQYAINFQVVETRGHVAFTNSNAQILRRSNSFFDFQPLPGGAPANVFLPTVSPAPDPSTGFGPTYNFHVTGIVPGGKIFIDPFVAVGYDYAIGVGDPNFASVLLPALQGDPFLLSFLGEPGGQPVSLLGGTEFFFPAGGVDHFSVRGIHPSLGLDPGNVIAFITGLTFAGSGDFTGSMTPVITFVAAAGVPEPSTLLLLLSGGLGLLGSVALSGRRHS